MDYQLTPEQLRIIGCLLEKEVTTPDQYPLSVNGLQNACNQKSNRDPVMNLEESDIRSVLDELSKLHLVTTGSNFGSRVSKYQHRFCNTEFGDLKLSDQEKAILCVLFLRGPQTPGELRSRTQRMCEFTSVAEVEQVLQRMANQEKPFVRQLEREPGKRESRWLQLFGDNDDIAVPASGYTPSSHSESNLQTQRIEDLESQVAELREELLLIKQELSQKN